MTTTTANTNNTNKKNVFYPRARFNFCGAVTLPTHKDWVTRQDFVSRDSYTTNGRTSSKISASFGIKDGANCVFVNATDFKNNVIKTYDRNGKALDVNWDDRLDKDIIDNVAGYKKYIVDLGEPGHSDRKEFITAYDMIEYLEGALPGYAENIVVTGEYNMSLGKGRVYENFNVRNVFAAKATDVPHFRMTTDIYYNADSFDKTPDENGKMHLSAFIPQYLGRDLGTKMMAFNAVLNTAVYNPDNARHMSQLKYKTDMLTPSNDNYVHMTWEIAVMHGAEAVEFNESLLTDQQRKEIELGLSKLDDFRPKGTIYGNSVREFRLVKPVTKDDFANGPIDSGYNSREFAELVYKQPVSESMEEVLNAAMNTAPAPTDDYDDDDLF